MTMQSEMRRIDQLASGITILLECDETLVLPRVARAERGRGTPRAVEGALRRSAKRRSGRVTPELPGTVLPDLSGG